MITKSIRKYRIIKPHIKTTSSSQTKNNNSLSSGHFKVSKTYYNLKQTSMDESGNQGDVEMEGDTNDPPQQQTTTTTSSSDDAPEHSSKKRKREEPSTVSVPSSGTTEGDGDGDGEGETSAERSDLSSSDSNKKAEGNGGQSSNGEQSSSGNASSSDNAAAKSGQHVQPANNIEKVWLALLKERPSKGDREKMKLWIECVLLTSEYMAPSAPSDEQDSSNSKSSGSNSGSNSMSNSGGNISNDELSELLVADAMSSLESIHRVMLRGIPKKTSTDTGQISSATTNSSDEKNSSNSRSSNEEEEMKDASPPADAKLNSRKGQSHLI